MSNKIEFVDLKRQYASIQPEIDAAVSAIIQQGAFIGGAAVDQFEADFAAYCQTRYAIGVANGTDALQLALRAMGVGPGDEVITSPHTFIATVAAIATVGARPVLADIDPDTYCLNPAALESCITSRTKAIVPVHIYGQPADMDAIMAIAERYNLGVLEDACQAHGAYYKGRRAGSLGHIAAFSFYPGKNLGAYGDGGAVTTNDRQLAERVRQLRDHGRIDKYQHAEFAYNSRLDGLQAAVLNVKLQHLDDWNNRRRELASYYAQLLADCPNLTTPFEADYARGVYHLYVIRTEARAALQAALTQQGIGHGIHYPIPIHLQPAWQHYLGDEATGKGTFPLVEQYADQILSLPMHPNMTNAEVEWVADTVRQTLK